MAVPPFLGSPDGFPAKTNKNTFLHYRLEDSTTENMPYPKLPGSHITSRASWQTTTTINSHAIALSSSMIVCIHNANSSDSIYQNNEYTLDSAGGTGPRLYLQRPGID